MNGKEMRERENTPDQFFETARRNVGGKPLLDREELHAHMDRVDAGEKIPTEGHVTERPRYVLQIAMMTLLSVLTALLLFTSDNRVDQPDRGMSTEGSEAAEYDGTPESTDRARRETPDERTDSGDRTTVYPKGQQGPVALNKEGRSPEQAPESPLLLEDLTPEEIAEIFDIRFDGRQLTIPVMKRVSTGTLSRDALPLMKDLGFDLSDSLLDISRDLIITPSTRESEMGRPYRNESAGAVSRSFLGITMVTETDTLISVVSIPEEMARAGWHERYISEGLGDYLAGRTPVTYDSLKSPMTDAIIGIPYPLQVTDKAGNTSYIRTVAWYAPTEEFIEAIPARYREATYLSRIRRAQGYGTGLWQGSVSLRDQDIRLYPGTYQIRHTRVSSENSSQATPLENITGLRYVDLDPAEAERLGIVSTDSGFSTTMRTHIDGRSRNRALLANGYEANDDKVIVGFSLHISPRIGTCRILPPGTFNIDTPSPVVFSTSNQNEGSSFRTDVTIVAADPEVDTETVRKLDTLREALFRSVRGSVRSADRKATTDILSQLVPVRIFLRDDTTTSSAVYWYVPTEDFLSRLPVRYREELQKELETIAAAADGADLCDRIAGEKSFLGICREQGGMVTATALSPNPANSQEELTVRFNLAESRRIRITLHDLSGRFISELQSPTPFTNGTHSVRVSLEGVDTGTYLVSIESDEGDRGVQRLVVGR